MPTGSSHSCFSASYQVEPLTSFHLLRGAIISPNHNHAFLHHRRRCRQHSGRLCCRRRRGQQQHTFGQQPGALHRRWPRRPGLLRRLHRERLQGPDRLRPAMYQHQPQLRRRSRCCVWRRCSDPDPHGRPLRVHRQLRHGDPGRGPQRAAVGHRVMRHLGHHRGELHAHGGAHRGRLVEGRVDVHHRQRHRLPPLRGLHHGRRRQDRRGRYRVVQAQRGCGRQPERGQGCGCCAGDWPGWCSCSVRTLTRWRTSDDSTCAWMEFG